VEPLDWFRFGLGVAFTVSAMGATFNWRALPDEDRHGALALAYATLALVFFNLAVGRYE
jgi:hypothetical protein